MTFRMPILIQFSPGAGLDGRCTPGSASWSQVCGHLTLPHPAPSPGVKATWSMHPKKQAMSRLVEFLASPSALSGSQAYWRGVSIEARLAATCARIDQVTRRSIGKTATPGFGSDIRGCAEFARRSARATGVVAVSRFTGAVLAATCGTGLGRTRSPSAYAGNTGFTVAASRAYPAA